MASVGVRSPEGRQHPPGWWWNPLSYIGLGRDAECERAGPPYETKADKLAGQFVTSSRPEGARQDAYFDSEAENLSACWCWRPPSGPGRSPRSTPG